MKIALINCHEEMATGLRILASIAKSRGHDVHIIIVHGYEIKSVAETQPEESNEVLTCVNGQIRTKLIGVTQTTPHEWALFRNALIDFQPDLVGLGSRSNMELKIARALRQTGLANPLYAVRRPETLGQ
jgi:hypothetical protein